MPNGTYGGVRVRKTRVERKLLRFPATRFLQKSCENFGCFKNKAVTLHM